jgi:SAM-dependent methyltransferase
MGMIGRWLIPHQLRRARDLREQREFERKYGFHIGESNHEVTSSANLLYGDNAGYAPVPLRQLKKLFKALPISSKEYGFIDLGCGKGAALVVAVEGEFQAVIGIEVDRELAASASQHIQRICAGRLPPCAADIVHSDAAAYQFPDIPSIIFMFNPFGEVTMRAVLRNIDNSLIDHPRELYVAYFNPVLRNVFESSTQLVPTKIRHVPSRFVVYKNREKASIK